MTELGATSEGGAAAVKAPVSLRWKLEAALIAFLLLAACAALAALLLLVQPGPVALEAGLCFLFCIAAVGLLILHRATRHQARIRLGEARFADLIDHAPDGIVLLDCLSGQRLYANQAVARMFRMPMAEILNVPIGSLSAALQSGGEPARDQGRQWIQLALAGEEVVTNWRFVRSNGEEFASRLSMTRVPGPRDIVRVSIIDISRETDLENSRNLAERARDEISKNMRLMVDHAPEGVLLVEPHSRKVRYSNQRAGAIFGIEPALMQTGRITDIAIDPQPDGSTADSLVREMEQEAFAGRESSRIWLVRRAGGDRVNIEVRAILLPGESGVFRVSIIDMCELAALEQAAARAEEALRNSEMRFRHVAKMSTDWYWETGLDDRFSLLEGGSDVEQGLMRKLIGFLPWEFTGFVAVDPPWAEILALRSERQPYRQLLRYAPRLEVQGSARMMEIIGEPVFDAQGRFGGYRGVARDITGRHQAEQRLAESEERFRRLTELSSDWQWEQDAQFRFTRVSGWGNREAAKPEHYMGKCRWERHNMRPVGFTWEEHRRLLEAHLPFSHLVVEHTDSAGQRYYWAIRGEPVFGGDGTFTGYRGVGSDISQRFLTEAALAESAERYRKLVELSQEGVVIHDHGSIVYANPCLNSMLRVPQSETLVGRDIADFFSPEDVPHFRQRQSLLRASGDSVPFVERRLRCWDGEWVEAEVAGSLVEHAGRPVFQTQIRDISARKWTEQEILRLNASLEQRVASRTAELSAANHELESFSYTVAHDLRAPLRAVDGYAQMLRIDAGDELSESALRDVNAISASARKMAQLIDGLLDFARLGRGGLGHQRIETGALVAAVVRDAVPDGRVQINAGALPDVWGDAAMLRQVWINLIGNAVKFSAGKPAPVIHINCRRERDELIFSVRDNGAGFDPRYAGKLFGVFQRLHSAQEFEGTGVGLAIVKRIIERHGGRIWAEGESGQGATFYYALPAARSTGAGGAAPAPAPAPAERVA